MGVGIADFDLDGLLDIFVANDKVYNSYFHNKGNGKFEETSFDAGVALTEDGQFISGMGVDARDLDNDGLPDIVFVALENETFPVLPEPRERRFRRHHAERAAWLVSRYRWPATHRTSPIWTTTAGRIFSSRAATSNPSAMHPACR